MTGSVSETGAAVVVRMGELEVGHSPAVLVTYGLGSCLGLALFDAEAGVGGLAHIMLPNSQRAPSGTSSPGKFADLAVPELLRRMTNAGADPARIRAKLVGGAHMFGAVYGPTKLVGPRNLEAVRLLLIGAGIQIEAEEIGGTVGRTVHLHTDTGRLVIQTARAVAREI